jgi:hypothetical protein
MGLGAMGMGATHGGHMSHWCHVSLYDFGSPNVTMCMGATYHFVTLRYLL